MSIKELTDDELLESFMHWFRVARNENKMNKELKEIIEEMKSRDMYDILINLI